jgi:predicted metal-dependent phosphoesterase TrpH
MRTIDLHTHSNHSDGTVCPAELVNMAQAIGLTAVALCDHNTLTGLPEFVQAGEHSCVETVCGIEFSTDYGDTELHILGLFVQPCHWDPINRQLAEAQHRKDCSNRALVQALNRAGIPIDYDHLKESTAGGFVNRAVIGAEMTRIGVTASVQDAFRRYLHPRHGFYVPPKRLDAYETIGFLKELGVVSVLAHPFLNLDEDRLRHFLPDAVGSGLDGMETLYPKFTPGQTALARQIAAEFGLSESGGSDFHGENKPETCLGTGIGNNLAVPEAFLNFLRTKVSKTVEKNREI